MALDWRHAPSLISERQCFARPSPLVIPAERSESRDPGAKNSVRHVWPLGPEYSPAANSGMARMAGAQPRDDSSVRASFVVLIFSTEVIPEAEL